MNEQSKLRWGIIGLGKMAHQFTHDLILVEGAILEAVASRDREKAMSFASEYGAHSAYGSYLDILEDENVDIIYIATPHNSHMQLAKLAMGAGKHILCEKPMGVNQHEVKELIECADHNGVFLMEALWSRFNPSIREVFRRIKKGDIGEVNYINADFNFYSDAPNESRLFNPHLAGGALLDIGIYPIFLAYSLLGVPENIKASSIFHSTGVDLQTSAILEYGSGIANINCGFNANSDMIARIHGSEGNIFIDAPWHGPDGYNVIVEGNKEHIPHPKIGNGYTYEIEECIKCVTSGVSESKLWSLSNSLELITICDEIREQTGLIYPF